MRPRRGEIGAHLFTLNVETAPPAMIAGGPEGIRGMNMALGGTFAGPRLAGSVRPGGGDRFTMRASGSIRLDVRLVLTCDDGTDFLLTYGGIATPSPSGPMIRIAPTFEAPSGLYAWLNDVQAIGWGGLVDGGVSFDLWELD
jgi:hypothetical protein